jgi:nucleoside-diphosphate-sugar epimerase
VTGANGFIGRHLIKLLLERGYEVRGLVRTTSDTSSLAPLFDQHGDRLHLVIGDVRQPSTLAGKFDGVEYVFHLAAVLLGLTNSEFRDTIVTGTQNVMEAARADATGLKRFVYVSSLAAAGPSPADGAPLTEAAECKPVSWYGTAKRDTEQWLRAHCGDVPVTIVRPVSVYGEGEQDLSRGTFPLVKLGFQPRVGFSQSRASFVYVGDLVRGMVAAAESERAAGHTYFLADPTPVTTADLGEAIADAVGQKVRIPLPTPVVALQAGALFSEWSHQFTRARPMTTLDKVRELRQTRWVASPAAAKSDFGWETEVALKPGLKREVDDVAAVARGQSEMTGLPTRDRAVMTYTLAVLVGVVLESLAKLGNWYAFSPQWLIFVVIFVVIGGLMGTVAFLTVRWPAWAQFLAGAAVGVGAELLNVWVLHAWTFNPSSLGLIKSGEVRAIVVGLPAGLMPVGVNMLIRVLYRRRLRLG